MSIFNPYESAGVTPPSTTTTTCAPTYVSITLNAGNSFVLPPGATLVGVSDKDKVQSDCANIDALEEFSCYIFYYNVKINPITGEDPQESVDILSVVIDGVNYTFPTPVSDGSCSVTTDNDLHDNFVVALTSVSLSGLISEITVSNINNENACTRFFCFKTVPSVAAKMQIKIKDTSNDIINPIYLLPLYTWAQLPAGDIDLDQIKATCSCGPDYDPTTTTTAAPQNN